MASPKPTPDQERWAFVTTSPTTRRPTAAQRTLMRRHIMRDIGYSRRRPQQDFALGQIAAPASREEDLEALENITLSRALLSTSTALVTIDDESRWVLHHIFSDALPSHIRLYREKWYPACIHDSAAFHQMLACSATHLFNWQPALYCGLQRVAISKHAQALALARERLNLTSHPVAEGYLVAILMFACYAHLHADVKTWTMHMAAIRNIIASRSSDVTQSKLDFMRLYQSIDSVGSYAFGVPLTSQIPVTMPLPALTQLARGESLMSLMDSLHLQFRPLLTQAFQSLQDVNEHLTVTHTNTGSSVVDDPWKMDALVEPVARLFLFLTQPANDSETSSAVLCYLRAGALLYLAELRRRSGISPVITAFHIRRLKESIEIVQDLTNLDPELHLWFLTVGALESTNLADHSYFCSRIKRLRPKVKFETMTQYQENLHGLVWFDAVFQPKLSSLFPHV